ncbi:DUF3822 family protein [Winogradskyella sp. DF17]|uniref:DUF3822 family protein n=1 Tax=Winogradskyella pelagia TaxID=2819984 RepID=A0ABS3T4T9_9FLAO|nr:DUF3822 family protein [Winogradskyella sp. DF17]MBO3117757.1 DUF3822 family protein [Winogradskyella sp. DF17]
MAKTNIKELSIQVNLNGLSFCILNRSQNSIEYLNSLSFERKLSPLDVLNRLKTELSSNTVFSDDFDDILVIHQNELATLVPADLYNEAYKADYLKFNSKILRSDFITHDTIAINKSVNIYVPYVNINNYIFDTFGEFVYKHASSVLIDYVLQKEVSNLNSNSVYINVNPNAIECAVVDKSQLHLYNYFEYQTKEDFIYYILFIFEQLNLDTETIPIKLSGTIAKNDELYSIIYKYVRHVDFVDDDYGFNFPEVINANQRLEHFLILNSF